MAKQHQSRRHRGLLASVVILALAVLLSGGLAGFAAAYSQRFPPRTRIGDVEVGGFNYLQALQLVKGRADRLLTKGLVFRSAKQTIAILPTVVAQDEFSYDLFSLDAEATVKQAYEATHAPQLVSRLVKQLQSALFSLHLPATATFNGPAIRKAIEENFASDEQRAVNARLRVTAKPVAVSVVQPSSGYRFDYDAAVQAAREQVAGFDPSPINLQQVSEAPTISASDAQALIPQAKQALGRVPFTVSAGDKSFSVSADAIASAITPVRIKSKIALGLDADKLASVFDQAAKVVEVPVQEARFALQNGRATEFSQSRVGVELNRQATADLLASRLLSGEKTVPAVTKESQPKFTTASINNLGITELVAQGKTNFAGSPPNRRFNIGVGATKLNGLLIQPGQEFSLLQALGPIDAKNGFKQELVIKGNRTIPEFGGGLCQIGTTTFRLVLNAGLPILERQNHSYRVRYYEPPVGMDATIYEPKPDFRFKNDYTTALLLQTRIDGDNLIFEFYGTKDSRTVDMTTPRVFRVVPAPAKKTIETTDLAPDETKCIEKAHPGSDAEFTYTVTYPDGHQNQQTFKSHYKPWGEVCLVGVKKDKTNKKN